MTKPTVLVVGHNYQVMAMFKIHGFNAFDAIRDKEPDLLCFTGGADVQAKLYNEPEIKETHSSSFRDEEDLKAWNKYPNAKKVGICRGAQFLNVMSGGKLWQHVTNHGKDHLMINLLKTKHIQDHSVMITSTHHQMMIPGEKGEVIGIALKDGKGLSDVYLSGVQRDKPRFDTEVVFYPETHSLCCQFHPEYVSYRGMTEYFFKLINHFYFS